MVEIGAVSRNWASHRQFSVVPDGAPLSYSCSHLVVSIHLHSLIITEQFSPSCTPLLFLLLHLWPGRSFHSSSCAATQKVRPSPKFRRNFTARPWVSTGLRKWEGGEEEKSVCVTHRLTQMRGGGGLCGSTPAERETWFIITKNQLQMSVHRFSLCRQL